MEQLSLIKNSHWENVVEANPIESSREIAHMQVGQCGTQEAHAKDSCRRRRAVRAIALWVKFSLCKLSSEYLICSATIQPSRAAAGLRRDFLPQAKAA
jgi:hypothetical protein